MTELFDLLNHHQNVKYYNFRQLSYETFADEKSILKVSGIARFFI